MTDLRKYARRRAQIYGLDPNAFERQIQQESGFNPNARSPVGATGIAQIMPATAQGWHVNPNDPKAALNAAAKHMAEYVHKYGSLKNALVAYNAGPGRVGGPLPAETQNYIKVILGGKGDGGGLRKPVATSGSSSSSDSSSSSSPRSQLIEKFDAAGYDKANRASIVANLLAKNHGTNGILFKSGLLSTEAPSRAQFTTQEQVQTPEPSRSPSRSSGGSGSVAPAPRGGRIATFEGRPVAAWMVPALRYARSQGWKGSVTSGVRTRAKQAELYANRASNPNPVAKPGQSNHEVENGGAVDVSDYGTLAQIMRRYKGRKLIQGTAINDPVHFSATGR